MTTFLGTVPCLDRFSFEAPAKSTVYPLEKGTRGTCPLDPNLNERYDKRFQSAGFQISEFDL